MNRKGVVLVIAFIIIVVMMILGGIIISRSISENFLANNHTESTQAFWLAEAGVNDALNQLRGNYSIQAIADKPLGLGGYSVVIAANPDSSRTVTARGFIPFSSPFKVQRSIVAEMNKLPSIPEYFYDNAIYSAGDVSISGNAYDVSGSVRFGTCTDTNSNGICDVQEHSGNISGTITYDNAINPLARLDFQQLRALSQAQGNYHDAEHLNGPFPASFWYSEGVPNVIFLEGNLDLTGKTQVGGFFVVGGEFVYDAAISGNVNVDGCIYTRGGFTINGGGNQLNVDGGVWSGQNSTLNGYAKIVYNSTYMHAIEALDINTSVQIISWKEAQNPYPLTP